MHPHMAGLAIVGLLVAVRILLTGFDPPTITWSGSLLTDEGWYSKPALLFTRFGAVANDLDFTVHPQVPAKVAFDLAVFSLFGTSLSAARIATVVVSGLGLFAYYLIWRRSPHRWLALPALLAIGCNVYVFTFSGLAFTDPLMVSCSLMAIALWAIGRPGGTACAVSLLLASFVVLLKLSGVFTFAAVAALWALEAAKAMNRGDRRLALSIAALIGGTTAVSAGIYGALAALYPSDWQFLTALNIEARRVDLLDPVFVLGNAWVALVATIKYSGAAGFVGAALIAVIIGLLRRDYRQFGRELRALWRDPVFAAFTIWLVAGLAIHATIAYHPPRYYLFTAFPVLYITAAIILRLGGGLRGPVLALAAIAHIAAQFVIAGDWFDDPFATSYRDAAQQIAEETTGRTPAADGEVVLLGTGLVSVIALFDARIRPIDFEASGEAAFCARMARWRPHFMVLNAEPADMLTRLSECGLTSGADHLASYRILKDYRGTGDHHLYALTYR